MYGPDDLPVMLFTARKYEREVISKAPASGVVLKLTDVTDLTLEQAVENYWQLLNQNASVAVIALVATANNLVLDEQHHAALHEELTKRFLRPEVGAFMRQPLENDLHPTFRVALTRLGSLLTLKLLITLLPDGNQTPQSPPPDPNLAGDFAVLANEFTGSSSIREGNQPSLMELVLEFVPRWEIDNPPDLAYSWGRTFAMLQHLGGNDPTVRTLRDAITLDVDSLRFYGLTLGEFVAATFAVFTQMKRLSPDDPVVPIVDAESIANDLRFSSDIVKRFLSGTATSLEAIKAKLQPVTREEYGRIVCTDVFATDTVVLRQNPIISLPEDKFLVLDRHFVSEMVSSGIYWRIFESRQGRQRERLRDLWGRLFELYVVELLGHYYPSMSQMLSSDVSYADGQIDALLDLGDVVVVFEFKASLLLRHARFSRDPAIFEQDIRKKFVETTDGKPKALKQLVNAASAIARGTVATATAPRRIFPVLVSDEASLQSLGVNQYLNELFTPLIPAELREAVAPLTVMAIEELEELLPYVSANALSWATFLEERFTGGTVAMESIHQAIYVHQRFNGVPHLRNEFLLEIFHRMWEDMISSHRTGEPATT